MTEMEKMIAWLEGHLGGRVTSCERQVRWRPGWLVDLAQASGETLPLYVRGDRNEEFPPWPLEYEYEILTLLQSSSLPVPKVYGFCPDPRCIVLERMPGRPNLKTAGSEAERLSVLDDLAHRVAAMHAIDITPFAAVMATPATTEQREMPFFLEGEKLYLRRKQAPDPRMEFIRAWVHRNVPQNRQEVCLLHGDPGQFLFQDGRITTMLDFEWACLGDPLMDLGGLRMRALHEPMGDITTLFATYARLTGRTLPADVIGFHTVAFISTTCLAISAAVAHPNAGVDYPEYVGWYIASLLFAIACIAEIKGITLHRPPAPIPTIPSRWSPAFDVLATTFGNSADGEQDTTQAYRATLARGLSRFLGRAELYGDTLDRDYIAEVAQLTASSPVNWQQADAALERFVATAGPQHDATLLQLFHAWSWRQIALLEGNVHSEMWNERLQPLHEIIPA